MIFYVSLNISYREFFQYYQQLAQYVEIHESQGKLLRIHARHLRRFLTLSGIQGQFKLELTPFGELSCIERVML